MPRQPKSDHWYAWALVAFAALLFTNAGWYYRWKVRAAEHVEAINSLIESRPKQEPRVVYEYRQGAPAYPQRQRQHRQPQVTRDLMQGEECRGGVIIQRTQTGLESTGERCRE